MAEHGRGPLAQGERGGACAGCTVDHGARPSRRPPVARPWKQGWRNMLRRVRPKEMGPGEEGGCRAMSERGHRHHGTRRTAIVLSWMQAVHVTVVYVWYGRLAHDNDPWSIVYTVKLRRIVLLPFTENQASPPQMKNNHANQRIRATGVCCSRPMLIILTVLGPG